MDWALGWTGAEFREAWIRSFPDVLGWGLLVALLFLVLLIVLFSRGTRRRRFWCIESRREVEVEFEERGFPGFRRPVAVKSCSIFEPPAVIGCRRRCLDAEFRRRWPPALPVGRLE